MLEPMEDVMHIVTKLHRKPNGSGSVCVLCGGHSKVPLADGEPCHECLEAAKGSILLIDSTDNGPTKLICVSDESVRELLDTETARLF